MSGLSDAYCYRSTLSRRCHTIATLRRSSQHQPCKAAETKLLEARPRLACNSKWRVMKYRGPDVGANARRSNERNAVLVAKRLTSCQEVFDTGESRGAPSEREHGLAL
jgi:hypothetical protein